MVPVRGEAGTVRSGLLTLEDRVVGRIGRVSGGDHDEQCVLGGGSEDVVGYAEDGGRVARRAPHVHATKASRSWLDHARGPGLAPHDFP